MIWYHQPQTREGRFGAIIEYQPTRASAAAWRSFILSLLSHALCEKTIVIAVARMNCAGSALGHGGDATAGPYAARLTCEFCLPSNLKRFRSYPNKGVMVMEAINSQRPYTEAQLFIVLTDLPTRANVLRRLCTGRCAERFG